jgi:Domain of unknown function (DUF4124)
MLPLTSPGKFAMARIALFASTVLAAACAHAQVYKCADASGSITYSQRPCPASTKSEPISRNVSPAAAAAAKEDAAAKAGKGGPMTPAEQEQAFRKRQLDQAKAAKESDQKNAEAERKAESCANARQRLAQYEIGGRISRVDAQGERYYMEYAQIDAEKARARADVSQYCG